ncbi:ABC transporter substrate-binding protein [Rhizobium daejeonense]|uniref:ABC transporter substrate-binding protein n=1 Tax=Rhizobium daejeonense TaxID=240521 RepID=A0A6M1S4B7_9HYPH|nr:ABC transporter substrate-binding protein [Rhizobium daejeonense]NGO66019.1 ABC transporter substrate-binding protein [Rhizobium daejeonense]
MLKRLMVGVAFTMMISSAQAAEKVTVLLDWFINPDHAPILVAEQIGAFKEAGLEVEIVPPADPSMPPRLVAAKQGDIAISYQPQLYMYAQEGLPLVRVGTIVNSPLNTIAVLGSSGIKSMADLKGKKIGYSVSGIEEATLGTMLQQGGLTLNDVSMINVNFQLVSSLMAGQVDAVIGGYRNFEATEIRDLGVEPVLFNVEDFGVPAYDELIVLANKDSVSDPKIRKFMDALKKGTEYLLAHPQETWEAFAEAHPDLDNNLNKQAWKDTLPMFAKDPLALDVARYEGYGKFLFQNKLVKAELPLADYAVELK